MKSILLIGMGKFGQTLGTRLLNMGDEVMIVDKNEDIINALAPKYTNALIANCMNADNLSTMDIPSFDVCVVAIGDDFQSSLEITSLLKDLGAKYVVSKATTEIQRKFLLRNGADEVIYPDRDIAEKLAVKLNSAKVFSSLRCRANGTGKRSWTLTPAENTTSIFLRSKKATKSFPLPMRNTYLRTATTWWYSEIRKRYLRLPTSARNNRNN